ncbi:MAG: NAD(P)/FAD-dependent oxidoreductase [Proteobacteria bacterium]|nr:NAD(P)/FAD-dependent oxidoreductase [Pseudomonadota bacterium]
MTNSPKAVVIGSGMGGLTAAILLQRQGYAVTVLEQHYRPGGLLHRFHRKGAQFDTGFHYCGGIEKGQALGQCLRHLGVFDDLSFHELDPDGFDRLRFPDFEFRVPRGWEAFRERLVERFPHEAVGIDAVLSEMQRAAQLYGLYKLRMDSDLSAVLKVEKVSLADVLQQHIRDPKLKSVLSAQGVLYGVAAPEAPFGVHSLIMDHFLDGAWAVEGGGDKLVRAVVRKIRGDGGEVLLRSEVSAIEVEGREATAVHTADGRRFEADLVISNLHPALTVDLLPEGAVRKAYRSRVRSTKLGHAHMGVYLQVDGRVPELGRSNVYRYTTWDLAGIGGSSEGVPFYFATAPTEHAPQRRPGSSSVLMIAAMPWTEVQQWSGSSPDARPDDYLAFKNARVQQAVDALVRDFPTLGGRISKVEGSTPLSTLHYTRSPDGAVYGHRHTVAQMGRHRPMPFLRVRNMALVGQGVGMPGVLGVMLSAYYVIGSLFDKEALVSELKSA